MFRRSNLPLEYADEIYCSDDLITTVRNILGDSEIYKILWFYKSELIEEWEVTPSIELAEAIAKYVIRMASRTTINQLFGVIITERAIGKEKYFLSTDYLKVYYINKLFTRLKNRNIYYRLGNLLKKEPVDYSISGYIEDKRRTVTIQKNTVIGSLLEKIENENEISSDNLYQWALENGFTHESLIKSLKTLYSLKAIVSNIDMESLTFGLLNETEEKKQQRLLLKDDEIEQLNLLLQLVGRLRQLPKDDFFSMVKKIKKEALFLLDEPFKERIINGYRRDYSRDYLGKSFSMGKRTKQLFEVMGLMTTEAEQMENFQKLFIHKYGLFQAISITDTISLYEEIKRKEVFSKEKIRLKEFFENKIREAQVYNQITIELQEEDIDKILSLKQLSRRINEREFEVKYQRHGNDIILSEFSFFYPGALSCAYLEKEEMDIYKRGENMAALFYNPEYLSMIGCPRGLGKTERIRLDAGGEDELIVNNLGIMADYDGIHLIDKKNRRKILPYNPTMKSYDFFCESIVIEFLDHLGRYLIGMPAIQIPINFRSWNFIPEIRYRNMVLQKRRWILKKSEFTDRKMNEIRSVRKINRYVCLLTEKGEQKYLDLDSKLAIKWLDNYVQNHQYILLEEFYHEKGYCIDYIMPIIFECRESTNRVCFFKERPSSGNDKVNNYSSWHINYKLDKKKRVKEELLQYVRQFTKNFFYIYYIEDEKEIIRFRIRNDEIEKSIEFFEQMIVKGIISDFSLHHYQPETIRYGGSDYIEQFEEIFEKESEICLSLQINILEKEIVIYQIVIIVAMLTNILTKNSISFFLNRHKQENKEVLKYYKHNKETILYAIETFTPMIQKEFYEIDQKIKQLYVKIQKNEDYNYASYILMSVLHMRLNRLIGVYVGDEELSFGLVALLWKKQTNWRHIKHERNTEDLGDDYF